MKNNVIHSGLKPFYTEYGCLDSEYYYIHMYYGPQVSQQKKKPPDKREIPTAKEKCSRQKRSKSQQKRNFRGKRKYNLGKKKKKTAKESSSLHSNGKFPRDFHSNNAEDDTNKILCIGEPHAYRLKTKKKQKLIKNHCDRKLE